MKTLHEYSNQSETRVKSPKSLKDKETTVAMVGKKSTLRDAPSGRRVFRCLQIFQPFSLLWFGYQGVTQHFTLDLTLVFKKVTLVHNEDDVMSEISASSETLMRQAPMTATEYLDEAIERIDRRLGGGYAKQHPELIGAFMQTAAIDFAAGIVAKMIERVADAVDCLAIKGN